MDSLFLDTYAMFEFIQGNPHYSKYQKDYQYLTTQFNLVELYHNLRKIGVSKEESKTYLESFAQFEITINNEVLIQAGEFRLIHKQKNLSYADCIGYVLSKDLGVPFLTGDKEFEGMENVLFIK